MIEPKKIDWAGRKRTQYVSVRFRRPSQFTAFRNPNWAANAATDMYWTFIHNIDTKNRYRLPRRKSHNQIEVTMGHTKAGNWLIQRILFPMHTHEDVGEVGKNGELDEELISDILVLSEYIQNRIEKEGIYRDLKEWRKDVEVELQYG